MWSNGILIKVISTVKKIAKAAWMLMLYFSIGGRRWYLIWRFFFLFLGGGGGRGCFNFSSLIKPVSTSKFSQVKTWDTKSPLSIHLHALKIKTLLSQALQLSVDSWVSVVYFFPFGVCLKPVLALSEIHGGKMICWLSLLKAFTCSNTELEAKS